MSVTEYINSGGHTPVTYGKSFRTIFSLHTVKIMIMLTGIKAFEARWQSLKATHPTSASDHRLLMQSMGRLVDNYASQTEIASELPVVLRGLFECLVDAYLNGYWIEGTQENQEPVISPALLAAKQRRQKKTKQQPTATSEAATYVIRDRIRAHV